MSDCFVLYLLLTCMKKKTSGADKFTNNSIGTNLMEQILKKLKMQGYKQASLSVQKMNYAVHMYLKVGFEIVDENDEEYIMICKL